VTTGSTVSKKTGLALRGARRGILLCWAIQQSGVVKQKQKISHPRVPRLL